MIYLQFELPWPPTLNTYWRHVGNKVLLSGNARAYRRDVGNNLLQQRVPLRALTGRLACRLDLHPPNERAFDIDNRPKGLLDALQHCEVYGDDNQIDYLILTRREVIRPAGLVKVLLFEIREHLDELPADLRHVGELIRPRLNGVPVRD